MEVELKKMGNSTVLVIPPAVLKQLRIGAGQHLSMATTADGKIVLTPRRKYSLADLIASAISTLRLRPTLSRGIQPGVPPTRSCERPNFWTTLAVTMGPRYVPGPESLAKRG